MAWLSHVAVSAPEIFIFLAVAIGTREFVFRSPTLGERRVTTTVTMKPSRIAVDFTKPDPGN